MYLFYVQSSYGNHKAVYSIHWVFRGLSTDQFGRQFQLTGIHPESSARLSATMPEIRAGKYHLIHNTNT